MAKKQYFGNGIEPSCSYCVYGNRSREGNKVLCEKTGRTYNKPTEDVKEGDN